MFDYVEQLPDGILKTLLNIVYVFYSTCTTIFEYGSKTIQQIIGEVLKSLEAPEFVINGVDTILSGPWAWIYHISLLEILLGGALIAVVVFGIIKYFTDIVL